MFYVLCFQYVFHLYLRGLFAKVLHHLCYESCINQKHEGHITLLLYAFSDYWTDLGFFIGLFLVPRYMSVFVPHD